MDTEGKLLRSRFGAVGLVAAAVVTGMGSLLGLGGPASAATAHVLSTSGLGYTALSSPVRIVDTRAGATDPSTYAGRTLAEGASLTVDVPTADIPATASAVVVNVTAINPSAAGYLTVYPGGGTNPGTANITFAQGQTVGNLVTVGLGTDSSSTSTQSFTVYNGPPTGGGSVDFTADLEGYYAPATTTSGGEYKALTPARIYDSRTGSNETGAGTTLTNGGSDNVTVVGVGEVPTSAKAVVLNVAVTNTTASSFITAYPAGAPPSPATASQNFVAGETLSSQVIAGVGVNGQVTIANHQGNADIVVDVDGYFTAPDGDGSLLTVLSTPERLLDTRPTGVAAGTSASATVVGTGATAGVLSIADVYTTTTGGNFLTAYPSGQSPPLAANVNYTAGDTYNVVENSAYATTGTGGDISILNGPSNAATTNIVVDEFGYFTQAPNAVEVVATPASITANGTSTSSVAAAVSGPGGLPVGGDTVTFTVSPASCGTFSPTSELTNTSGATPAATYTSSTTNEVCTVTATESATGGSSTATIDQTGAASSALVITATPQSVPDNGTTSQLTITASGPDASGEAVTLTGVPSTTGTPNSCGSFPATVTLGTSGATLGSTTATYTSSDVVGSCTIYAFAAASSTSGTVVISQTTVSTVYAESIEANPTAIAANGTATSSVTAGVTKDGAGLSGDLVTFALGAPSEPGSCGTLTSATETTASNGITPPDTYTASSVPGTCTITATEANGSVAATFITQQVTAGTGVLITATPGTLAADGTSQSMLDVAATVDGVGVSGGTVTLTSQASPAGACGTFPATVTLGTGTGGTTLGEATATYTASDVVGSCTIVATGPDGTGTSTTSISQTPPINLYEEEITATPDVLPDNGTATSSVEVTMTDNGNPVPNDLITFSAVADPAGACGSGSAVTLTTGTNGETPVGTYTASTMPGTCTITATDAVGQVSASVVVTQQASVTSEVELTADPEDVTADGVSQSTLGVAVSTGGVGDSGVTVALAGTPSTAGACGTFPSSVVTAAGGAVTTTYTASTTPGTCTILATPPAGDGTASVVITQSAPANVFDESITATPNSLPADGATTSSILVGVTENGAGKSGDVVTFTEQPSVTGACGALSSATETTNSSGITPSDTYTASKIVGTCTITGTEIDGGVPASVVITQTAPAASKVNVSASPSSFTLAGQNSTVTITTVTADGVAVPGQAILLSDSSAGLLGGCGTLSANSGTTNASGVVTVTYTTPNLAGIIGIGLLGATCTITATDTSVTPSIAGSTSITETLDVLP